MEVRRETVFEAEIDEVWDALTSPERLEEWFANDVALDLRPGGAGTFRWDDGAVRHARVERVEAGRAFDFVWWDEDGGESAVSISLDECDDGTRVSVVESTSKFEPAACAEWSWGVELLASLARLRPLARVR